MFLGPDGGELSNTKGWKKAIPMSVRSIYVAEGDLGFFSLRRKKYGAFFLALQSFSRKLFVCPIANTKAASLYAAISLLLKVTGGRTLGKGSLNNNGILNNVKFFGWSEQQKDFRHTKKLLFDGESALKSTASQDRIFKQFGLRVEAQPGFKRNSAERYVKEFKLRTRVALYLAGRCFLIACARRLHSAFLWF